MLLSSVDALSPPDFSNNDCCTSFDVDAFFNVCFLPRSVVGAVCDACEGGPDNDTTTSVADCTRRNIGHTIFRLIFIIMLLVLMLMLISIMKSVDK